MLSFSQFITEADAFPQEKASKAAEGPLKLTIKEPRPGVYTAHHKGKRVGAAITWKDLKHGKPSIYKSETHPDYRQKGVMRALYNHIEKKTGEQLHPSSTLSDDGHAFWSKFRPEAVKDDLRNHRDKLMGKEIEHPTYGKGVIDTVGSGVAIARKPNGNTFFADKELLRQHGHQV